MRICFLIFAGPALLGLGCAAPLASSPSSAPSAQLELDHPLTGQIWDQRNQRFISESTLVQSLQSVPFVLLGESHVNPIHHRLQARLVSQLADQQTTVAFEMLDQPYGLDDVTETAEISKITHWSESGWPDFSIYEPIFAATLQAKAHIASANPPKAKVRETMQKGTISVTDQERVALRLERDLPQEQRQAMHDLIVEVHCGHATGMEAGMVSAQILKNAWMARSLRTSGKARGILIAGSGHTRRDRGVPFYLDDNVLTVDFVEAHRDRQSATQYRGKSDSSDYLWFTARMDYRDPCDYFRKLKK